MTKKNILILTPDAGFGHRSTAHALATAVELRYGDAAAGTLGKPLDEEGAPPLLCDAGSGYNKLAAQWPRL